jgi:hypothetical protein
MLKMAESSQPDDYGPRARVALAGHGQAAVTKIK